MTFASTLLQWYCTHKRTLPWRGITDPYRIWLSEIILQQTQIAQGRDYYLRFTEHFPSVEILAEASEDEVMKLWEGLGYYSRARNLHAAARQIVAHGSFPRHYEDVRALKGIGDYTAAAICSIAYNDPIATLDGNAYRVYGRIYSIEFPFDSKEGKAFYKELANSLLDKTRPGEYNQAIMDFGATQCTPRNPNCEECPFTNSCGAHEEHKENLFPVRAKKPIIKERFLNYFFIFLNDQILIHKRGNTDIWKGLYEPYLVETECNRDIFALDDPWLNTVISGKGILKVHGRDIRHILTHRILRTNFYSIHLAQCPQELPEGYYFCPTDHLDRIALPALIKKNMKLVFNP